jgi:hypothetical protein
MKQDASRQLFWTSLGVAAFSIAGLVVLLCARWKFPKFLLPFFEPLFGTQNDPAVAEFLGYALTFALATGAFVGAALFTHYVGKGGK